MSTYTQTYAYTRAQAVTDQVSALFTHGGVDDNSTRKVCHGVEERWLTAVGLFLERPAGIVYEVEARINWRAHSDQADLDFDSNLPGWENNGSPEAILVGSRFAAIAAKHGLAPRFWVRFTAEIAADPRRYQELCTELGVGGQLPAWNGSPTARSMPLQDLREMRVTVRSTL